MARPPGWSSWHLAAQRRSTQHAHTCRCNDLISCLASEAAYRQSNVSIQLGRPRSLATELLDSPRTPCSHCSRAGAFCAGCLQMRRQRQRLMQVPRTPWPGADQPNTLDQVRQCSQPMLWSHLAQRMSRASQLVVLTSCTCALKLLHLALGVPYLSLRSYTALAAHVALPVSEQAVP